MSNAERLALADRVAKRISDNRIPPGSEARRREIETLLNK